MTEAAKDFAYYEAHPEEATVEVLEQLASASMNHSEEEPAKQDVAATAKPAEPESVASDAVKTEEGKEVEAPILSRDGKHTIPFDVLKNEREAKQRAEQTVRELQERIEALQIATTTDSSATEPGRTGEPTEPIISEQDMEALRVDFPAFAKVIEAQMAKISQLEAQVSTVSSKEADREAAARRTIDDQVRDAIDANPKLLELEKDPDTWAKVVKIDMFLRSDPENVSLTFDERFDQAVKLYEARYGAVKVADAVPETPKDDKSAKEKAAELLKKEGKAPPPRSLSDLPGGLPDPGNEKDRAENMSSVELGLMMQKMSPAQIDAYLNQL